MRIAVLGGGCVGLTTALQLQRDELRNASVDVVAESFERTTSHVAAGLFRVGSAFYGPSEALTRKLVRDSFEIYESISRSRDASEAGIASISGYMFSNISANSVKNELMESIAPIYRRATDEELKLVTGDWKFGSFMSTLIIQPSLYLPWAKNKLTLAGVNFVERRIDSLNELVKDYGIIINCTGLGAKALCQDRKMIPVKGQVVKVRAPWLKAFYYADVSTYVIPGLDGLTTLGGLRDFESSDLSVCPYQTAAIRDRCAKLLPQLGRSEIVAEKTGLRPYRAAGVRLDSESIACGAHRAVVIHNYGHGGYGISTAAGTSKYAVETAIDAHRSSAKL